MKPLRFLLALGTLLMALPVIFGIVARADTPCFSTHTFGSGLTLMNICISEHGNVAQFESPASEEHIRIGNIGEGYVLCSTSGVHGFDAGYAESGFGPATITQTKGPNTFPLTIVRETTDGDFRLTQRFSRDTDAVDVTISMELRNISGATRTAVRLARYFDGDIGASSGGDIWDKSEDSVWGREAATGENPALMLTALTFATLHIVTIEDDADWDPTGSGAQTARVCSAGGQTPPTSQGSFAGRARYDVGTMTNGQKKTVKFLYRRF